MDEKGFVIIKQLVSELEGAPFPSAIKNELYTIWYEHIQESACEALEYLASFDPDYGPESEDEVRW